MLKFITKHSIFSKSQFGFRNKRSCVHAILSVVEDICTCFDERSTGAACFVDLKKAFVTINQAILLQKLDRHGFTGKINGLLQSYLTNRKHFVISSGVSSSQLNIRYGVPQGSVLGPLLFLLYINDLPDSIENSKVTLYADDTVLLAKSSSVTAQEKLQKDLSDADDWCNRNKLTINTKKKRSNLVWKSKNQSQLVCAKLRTGNCFTV